MERSKEFSLSGAIEMSIVKLTEVYESTRIHSNEDNRTFSLREIYINPSQVVCLREAPDFKRLLVEEKLPGDLDSRQEFTRVHLNRGQAGIDIVVVGPPAIIESKIKTKQILKG